MKTSRILPLALLQLSLLLVSASAIADEPTDLPKEKLSTYMRAKLVHSQKILEALALENFDQLAKSSQDLKLMSQESNWNVYQSEQYLILSSDFRRRADALTEAAKNRNLDGASIAYMQITLSCVQCHKHVRDVKVGKLDKPAPSLKLVPSSPAK